MQKKSIYRSIIFILLVLNFGVKASDFECIIEPEVIIELGSPVPGVLETVVVKKGQRVKKGDIIATLVSKTEQAALEVAKARAMSDAALETALIRKNFSARKYERALTLSKQNHVSSYELDEAHTEMMLAEQAYLEQVDSLTIAKAELQRAEAQLNVKSIKSPIDGVVVDKYLEPGERVDNEAIARLAKVDPLLVKVMLPAAKIEDLNFSMRALVRTELDSASQLNAKVVMIDPIIDAASGLFSVQLELLGKQESYFAGLECMLSFAPGGN